ncbi:aldehyde dehydrogenase family protein [Dietzia maris]|uniref:aldehyde dehydrogenase family protein n=1 Tax=Dietzia maris TaxID=37915 RepID=UPI0021AF0C2D|nr:aldehyde dehydrogenase family protein [Dietzia maris]MCT1433492.1 aldehyde dehydrogenase family protein [Dietzia maris]MCT1520572.1 aldehyde dehydrogenase family protein [Dietzia maris]
MTQDSPSLSHPAPVALRNFVGGHWRDGTGATIRSINPTKPGVVVAHGAAATANDLTGAFTAARSAMDGWSELPIQSRCEVLLRAAHYLQEGADGFAEELTREEGKTLPEALTEVGRTVEILRYHGGAAAKQSGQIFPSSRAGEQILVTRRPLGVVGVITPFNFPLAIPAWKIAPALVHGNTVVWKPASTVPLLAMRLVEAFEHAGVPAGVLNLLHGGAEIGNGLVGHEHLNGLTFTGSTQVGQLLCGSAAARGVPVQAEMGGKNSSVVLADADLDFSAQQVLAGAFRSTGQKCTATSRLIVAEEVADEFMARLSGLLDSWQTGDPLATGTHMGPVISQGAASGIRSGVDVALAAGASVAYGRTDLRADGEFTSVETFIPPTVLELPPGEHASANPAWTTEFFGPVLTARRATSVDEAFALANEGDYGLSCALFTTGLHHTIRGMDKLDVGILHINSESAGAEPHVPFGGAKKSSYGPREQGEAAREFFTHTTTVYLSGGE